MSDFSDNKIEMINKIKKNLKELGFSENEIKVYVALTQMGESTAAKIAKKAELPRTTVIGILDKMKSESFLSAFHYKHSTYYWIESPKTIQNVFQNRIKIAQDLDGLLSGLYRSEADFPYAQILDSKASIRAFIEKSMVNLEKKSVIYSIDTPSAGNYTRIFSDDLYNSLLALKKKKGVITHTLVPFGAFKTIVPERLAIQPIVIREMPENLHFSASLRILKDTVVLFSGRRPFSVAIRHKLITESLKGIFDFLWSVSAPKN